MDDKIVLYNSEDPTKDPVVENAVAPKEVEKVVEKSSHVLLSTQGIFPFDLFPDKLIIDEEKITIHHYYFINSFSVKTILLKEIEDATCETALFLATLRIFVKDETEPITIYALPAKDALKAKTLLSGKVILDKEGIELEKVPKPSLSTTLEHVGGAQV